MNRQNALLVERLAKLEQPKLADDWASRDGFYLAATGVSKQEIDSLIDLVLQWGDCDRPNKIDGPATHGRRAALLPVTAWRTLADLKAEEAVEPLIGLLREIDGLEEGDDWVLDELPIVFGKIGENAIAPLDRLATDQHASTDGRSAAVIALGKIAEYHPATRDRVVQLLLKMMAKVGRDITWNTTVMATLVDLDAAEAAEAIERAFSRNRLDVGMIGAWEDVRRKLGVEGRGLKMPERPHNSIEQLRLRLGIGVFSEKPIFRQDDVDAEAASEYCDQCSRLFSRSPEAEEVIDRYGDLGWHGLLLEFGIDYRAEIIDVMSVETVSDFVLGFMPAKVTTEPDTAAEIIDELRMFWRFLDRVYRLPHAAAIVRWLSRDGLVRRLEAELADPRNYGMAKSLAMKASNAGYDIRSESDMQAFLAEYNRSLHSRSASPPPRSVRASTPPPSLPPEARQARRNSRCPCGSGKKYKKCCGRR